jgi:hypothetical protein
MLSTAGNMAISDNMLVAAAVERLAKKLPPGWKVSAQAPARGTPSTVDAVLRVKGPGATSARVFVEARRRVEPRDVRALPLNPPSAHPVLVVAPFLSPSTQQRLSETGFGYADLTGNMRLSLSEPGLFLETRGADHNPVPSPRVRNSLRGAKAGRLVRALVDFRPPYGVRELAKRAEVDPGYTSRIVDFLDREALVTRQGRGPIATVDWAGLLNRWSQEYSAFQRDRVTYYLAARGLERLAENIRGLKVPYTVSGSWAATQFAPVAPPRLLLLYTDSIPEVVTSLDLRPADAGGNVALATPFDTVVYERTSTRKGIVVSALSQVVADLLGAPGRGPNEAKALIQWMSANENAWRA